MEQSSRGSIDNIEGIQSGMFHSGFVQSDVAYWAYTGSGCFDGQTPAENLRAIAALYPEHIQLIARKETGIASVSDLAGKRVSLDERGSGSYVNAVQILEAYGPISGPEAEGIAEMFPFYSLDTIPAGAYEGVAATTTLAVGAQWITSTDMTEELVHQITEALWNDQSRRPLDVGHAKGEMVTLDTALTGIAIPLHPGAERFYKELGLLN